MKSCVPRLPEITCVVKNFIESAIRDKQRGRGLPCAPHVAPPKSEETGAPDLGFPETSHTAFDPKCFRDKQLTILRAGQFTVG